MTCLQAAGGEKQDSASVCDHSAFNAARFIAPAIQSVLQQSLPASEIVVVDDGLTDDTEGVVRGLSSSKNLRRWGLSYLPYVRDRYRTSGGKSLQ